MIKQSDKILAEELVKKGYVSQVDMDKCLGEVRSLADMTLSSYLVQYGFVSEQQVLETLASALHLDTVDLKNLAIEPSVINRVPVKFAWYYKFMPLKIENKILTVVSATPLDVKIQDELRVYLGLELRVILAKEKDVLEAIKKYYGIAAETIDRILTREPSAKMDSQAEMGVWVEDLEKESEDASVSKLVNQILLDAFQKRATDIHIEPYRDKVRLRYRIDGSLVDAHLPAEAKHFLRPILSRIKIMANLSIEEKRLPQDGSTVVKTKEQDLDLRVSTIPTPRGESIVIRILPSKVMLYSLEKLGLDSQNLYIFHELIKRPHGIILVTGPTGSGKTTTLYACLNEINSADQKIITIEDPIEYEMEGITQIQVNLKVNFDFARGLRSVLRHDPDIIMVGEIRDFETAEIAIRTALTGHLVFSTLHTNDAASGVTRLLDMGVEPFLVASSIEAFVAQRLLRVICHQCKEEVRKPLLELREEIAVSLKIQNLDNIKIYRGKGCEHCNNTGYLGRTAIYEVLVVNETIRKAILEKRRSDDIKRIVIEQGMITLRQDGWRKVMEGLTTPEEVMNVTVREEELQEGNRLLSTSDKNFTSHSLSKVKTPPRSVTTEMLETKNEYESRVYPRVIEKLNIRFQMMTKDPHDPNFLITDGIEHASYTKDISAGGVRFVSGHPVALGTILNLKIQLHEGERSVDCLGKVCRVEENGLGGSFNVVAYFLDISSADRVKINQFAKLKLEKS